MHKRDVVIIGGGPAGLAAAVELKKRGVDDILIIEREKQPGGILRQCIHDGFGLTRFGQTLSGPEYSQRFIDEVEELQIEVITNATVIDLTGDKIVTAAARDGLIQVQAGADVYKRQTRDETAEASAKLIEYLMSPEVIIEHHLAYGSAPLYESEFDNPVSYTHLDVYKRQPVPFGGICH